MREELWVTWEELQSLQFQRNNCEAKKKIVAIVR